jgi:hypothetical protein
MTATKTEPTVTIVVDEIQASAYVYEDAPSPHRQFGASPAVLAAGDGGGSGARGHVGGQDVVRVAVPFLAGSTAWWCAGRRGGRRSAPARRRGVSRGIGRPAGCPRWRPGGRGGQRTGSGRRRGDARQLNRTGVRRTDRSYIRSRLDLRLRITRQGQDSRRKRAMVGPGYRSVGIAPVVDNRRTSCPAPG